MSTSMLVGTAGRAHDSCSRAYPRDAVAPVGTADRSSFCFYCATWYFSYERVQCSRCGGAIFRWIPNADLHLFRSRSSLAGF